MKQLTTSELASSLYEVLPDTSEYCLLEEPGESRSGMIEELVPELSQSYHEGLRVTYTDLKGNKGMHLMLWHASAICQMEGLAPGDFFKICLKGKVCGKFVYKVLKIGVDKAGKVSIDQIAEAFK